jgi:hypothetical protein
MTDREKMLKLRYAIHMILSAERDKTVSLTDAEFRDYMVGFLTMVLENEALK